MAQEAPARRRFVRLEKISYPEDIARSRAQGSPFLIRANAAHRIHDVLDLAKRYDKDGMKGAAKVQRDKAARFREALDLAGRGHSSARDRLMKQHMVSSASSPFLSGTPSFTTGNGGQFSFMTSNLEHGNDQTVTVHQTRRAIANHHNTREAEMLIPHGERLDERVGVFHVKKIGDSVRPIFLDKTGDRPRLFLGRRAVERFKQLSQG